jgi:hypothetical protein
MAQLAGEDEMKQKEEEACGGINIEERIMTQSTDTPEPAALTTFPGTFPGTTSYTYLPSSGTPYFLPLLEGFACPSHSSVTV